MAGEEAPEKVQEANDARLREYERMVRMERKLQKKILEKGPGTEVSCNTPREPPHNGGDRTSLADPRTEEDAGAGWRINQSAQGCKTEGRQHQKEARNIRRAGRPGQNPRLHPSPQGEVPA